MRRGDNAMRRATRSVATWRLTVVATVVLASGFGLIPPRPAAAADAELALSRSPAFDAIVVDIWGSRRYASELVRPGAKATALVFMSTECPLVRLYVPTLRKLQRDVAARGGQVVGIFPNAGDDLVRIAKFAHDSDLCFPVFRDPRGNLSSALHVQRTPEVVVLDHQRQVVYRGRIDDQYRAGGRKPTVQSRDLADALNETLAGKPVSSPKTLASGCVIEAQRPRSISQPISYYRDIAPIVRDNCQTCHRPGQIGPFALMNYEDVSRHADMIAEVVEDRRMPPWHAVADEARFGKFLNDRRLTSDQIQKLIAWSAAGAPAGDPSDAPPDRQWPTQWRLGTPDHVFNAESFKVPAQGDVPYQYFEVQTRFPTDRWIKTVEAKPGKAEAVHHIHVHVSSPRSRKPFGLLGMWQLYGFEGEKARVVGSYLPGRPVYSYRPGYGMKLPRGAKLTFEVHYTPIGEPLVDQSSMAVVFTDKPPEHEVREDFVFMRELTIPAGDGHYKLTNTYKFQKPSQILSLTPHMHIRGKHWRFELIYPDGKKESVLTVPRWDFDWQGVYRFERPIPVPRGTRILATAHYDNSAFNPNNPDPTTDVSWGPQSWDEMMNFRVTFALDE